jgi:hypothetical protein
MYPERPQDDVAIRPPDSNKLSRRGRTIASEQDEYAGLCRLAWWARA